MDGTTSHRQIQQWWRAEPRANVGIATGAPGPDVVDVDVHQAGTGYGAFNDLKRAGLVPDPMAVIRTPSGGMHAYYRGTAQRNGHLPGKYVDFRSQGGYVVAPPSRAGGRPYEVIFHQPSAATFDWDAARQHLEPDRHRQPRRPPEPAPGPPTDLGHRAGWVAGQGEGNRNNGLFWAACRASEHHDTAALDGIARAARDAGLDEREIGRTIASAQAHGGPRR